ncbi:hypothetical protein AAFF_G00355030 [Aldrovandia affinis]|uniref:Reverse transcriptase domain-containing protein n=1 Tax=Aldrovandia affinis TaxID=143900 RepID=A0AAD7WN83_9TELE|nr:hypothetical protein AAFF_G00355030 [Aldrovandia affinis]
MAEWATTPARKRASSGDHKCPRDNKSAPSIPLGNRYEVLVGSGVDMDMDVCLGSLFSFLDGWAMDNLIHAGDIFLLQEVHLRDEEDVAAFTRPRLEGHRLEVFRDLPGCLSTMQSLILGGDFYVCLDGRDGVGKGGIDYSAGALAEVVKDFSLVDAFRALHPSDAGFMWCNPRGVASCLYYIFVGGGISGFYGSVWTLWPLFTSVAEWWEAVKSRFATFCRRYVVVARQRDRAGVAKWTASLACLHGHFNCGEPVDWAMYEGAKERLRGLLEARAKALAFQAWLRELEEGERPTAYFFKASRVHWGASAIPRLRRAVGTLAEGLVMLAVAETYYAKLFSRQACDPAAEAYLLDCITARLGGQSMEADVTLEEVREALLSLRDGRAPGHDGLLKEFYAIFWHLLGPDLLEVYRALLERGALSASMQKGILVLLYKGGDRTELGNWRPLTLLTTDCKVLAKVATAHLRRVMGGLVEWVLGPGSLAGTYSCVRVNGFLSGAVEQAGGVRQGCLLSPLLYVLFMEPFSGLVRWDPGVDGVWLLGAAGEVLKIQWTEDIGDSGRFAVCESGLKILGIQEAGNWEARLALVRSRLGVWSRRRLSLTGKVVVVRSVLLLLLLHLAYVFPVPARAKLALTRVVFRFLWCAGDGS